MSQPLLFAEYLPDGWGINKMSRIFSISMGQTILKEDLVDGGIYPVISATSEDKYFGRIDSPSSPLFPGDLVVTARGTIGEVKIVREACTSTQTTIQCRLVTETTYSKYAFYFLSSFKKELFQAITTAIPMLTVSDIARQIIPVPPYDEQQAIAEYLDRETGELDNFIADQEQLIAILNERRAATITQAVTKGLDPRVPMKDSIVRSLGSVPSNWTVTKIGFLTAKVGSGKTPRGGIETYVEDGIALLRSQNVHNDGLRLDDVVRIAPEVDEEMANTRVLPGDVLLNITGASLGRTCIVPLVVQPMNVNQHVSILRMKDPRKAPFVAYALKSTALQEQMQLGQNGAGMEGLNFKNIRNLRISLPDAVEQERIVKHLDGELAEIDGAIQDARHSIDLSQERRSALISAAVTGKIDVRSTATTQQKAA